jgi:uncharacterized protein
MSRAEIEAIRAVYEAAGKRDWDTAFTYAQPDFTLEAAPQNPIAGSYRGREQVRGFFEELWAAFESVSNEPDRFVELGDRVLVFLTVTFRPTDSDNTIQMRMNHLWTFEGGKAARCEVYTERAEALQAAGITERDIPA